MTNANLSYILAKITDLQADLNKIKMMLTTSHFCDHHAPTRLTVVKEDDATPKNYCL